MIGDSPSGGAALREGVASGEAAQRIESRCCLRKSYSSTAGFRDVGARTAKRRGMAWDTLGAFRRRRRKDATHLSSLRDFAKLGSYRVPSRLDVLESARFGFGRSPLAARDLRLSSDGLRSIGQLGGDETLRRGTRAVASQGGRRSVWLLQRTKRGGIAC